jgi:hypothetical protein
VQSIIFGHQINVLLFDLINLLHFNILAINLKQNVLRLKFFKTSRTPVTDLSDLLSFDDKWGRSSPNKSKSSLRKGRDSSPTDLASLGEYELNLAEVV